jgi:YVTN family beta-propeller protein
VALGPDNAVARIDPKTNRVTARIAVGKGPEGVATSPGAVWVSNANGPTVSRIDPGTNKVVATIRLAPARACCERTAIVASASGVWATVPKLGAVVRIDPATNKVVATIKLAWQESGQPCGFLAVDDGAVWSAGAHCGSSSGFGVVTRIDSGTNQPTGPVTGFMAPIGLAIGFGSVWAADLDAKAIVRIDPATGRIAARLPVGGLPVRLAIGFGSVWVRDDVGRVLRLRPQA